MIDARGNLWRYAAFQATVMTPLFVPVIVLFWQNNGLDMLQVYLLQGIFALAVVLLEVPTGTVADRLGKRASLLAGCVIMAAGLAIYGASSSFAGFLVGEVILAVGFTLTSGADSALLYDTLVHLGRTDEYNRREGAPPAAQMVGIALCSVAGGFLGEVSLRATLWLSIAGPTVAFFIALGFAEPGGLRRATDGAPGPTPGTSFSLIRSATRFVLRHRLVRWHVMFLAVLGGSATWLLWLYQPYMEWVGLPIRAFGIAFALFNLFAAGASKLAHRFDQSLGPLGGIIGLMALQVGPLILMALAVSPLSFLFILGHQAVRGMSRPVVSGRILDYTFADKRATVLSLASLAGRLFFALTAGLVGWMARALPMEQSLLGQAALLGLVLLALLASYGRIPNKYFSVKPSVRERQ